ncbi:MAG TPA: DnaD domain protein [Candidatus Coprovivens excrementavium]|nr:DnaD domain protein [Candidatus Coprovivens excrementavium]
MKEQVWKLLNAKKLVVNEYLIKEAIRNNLSLDEFLVLVYFDNSYNGVFEVELVSKILGLDVNRTMEAFNSLMIKGLVTLESVKDLENRLNEVVKLDGVYSSIIENTNEETKEEVKEDIFKTFEKELGRTMSPMELELINGWLISGTPEEIILGALREAVYNGVNNFRYIDKIIYEWEKKGFKNMNDVNAYIKNRYDEKVKDKAVIKKEQEISDYDWLDE